MYVKAHEYIRHAIRSILTEMDQGLKVVSAKKVGIDHKEGFSITLSDGTQDYAPLQGFSLKAYASGLYGCKQITGVMRGRALGGIYSYEFEGIDCEEYVEAYPETIRLVNQIS